MQPQLIPCFDCKYREYSRDLQHFLQKTRMNADIINLFDPFHLSQRLRHLKMEKLQGVSASLLLVLLCLFRMCHESIGSFYSHQFYGLFQSGKNCFYRMYNRSSMDWRKLLLRMSVRFMSILKEEGSGDLPPDPLKKYPNSFVVSKKLCTFAIITRK